MSVVSPIRFAHKELPSRQKAGGVHYTPAQFANFVATQIARVWEGTNPQVIDPAVGDGELLLALARELTGHGKMVGFDLDAAAVSVARARLEEVSPRFDVDVRVQDFLTVACRTQANDLFSSDRPGPTFDLAIANPPYVRTQVMGADQSRVLSRQFDLAGRVDLAFAFIEGIISVLRPGGIAGIIVSNRFMTTRAGASVRRRLLESFDILEVWDFGDTKLFEAAVLPAVLLLRKKCGQVTVVPRFTAMYSTQAVANRTVSSVFDAISEPGVIGVGKQSYLVRHGFLDHGVSDDGVWQVATTLTDEWLATVKSHTFCTFGDVGKIRVGVKTTADKVYIRSDWSSLPTNQQPELLRPLVTHHVARRYRAEAPARQILYTHEIRGTRRAAVDLSLHPRSERYLEQHRATLEARKYVIDSGRNWFEIWVPQNPAAWAKPKLVFPDISEKPVFWLNKDGAVINGDCYWLTVENNTGDDLLWLALAVANSTFIEEFYDHRFNNKLYAGRRRFMTQYVEQFPLPDPMTPLAKRIVEKAKRLYEGPSSSEATSLELELEQDVRAAFGVLVEEGPGKGNL